ncbi:MAG: sarcosine oxidase [Alphaproteobacteria bacterium]|nr:sarcosine oxidase [Alphaproteobacteria bacterium]
MADTGTIRPTDRLRRSFLYRVLEEAGASFTEINGAAVATSFGPVEDEIAAARIMAIADLSPLPRIGCKGCGALDRAREHDVEIGDDNNVAYPQAEGELAARLADTEVLILDSLGGAGTLPHRIEAEWSLNSVDGSYLVNRQGASFWFMVTGRHAPGMFAKLCAVDLQPAKFPLGAIAQTSVAQTNCIVIRADLGEVPAYHLLGDSASAEYQWGCLLDATGEFGGQPVGIEALRLVAWPG